MKKHKFNIFPEMSSDEFQLLKSDIEINGFDSSQPITVYQDAILDGWNRSNACNELNIKPAINYFTGSDIEAINFVMRTNKRRNLSSSQLAAIAVESEDIVRAIKESVEKERVEKIKNNDNLKKPVDSRMAELIQPSLKEEKEASSIIAKTFNTNSRYIYEATKLKDTNPEVFEQVKRGEKTLTEVKRDQKIEDRKINNTELLKQRTDLIEINTESLNIIQYDNNMFYQSGIQSPDRFGDKVLSLKDDVYYTVTTLERFFHKETGLEFSLREYAYVQTFPDNYKFIGNYTTIKKQIGNAVAPYMGAYITSKLKGKTVGDLFAGCGGFSTGAHQNGLITKWAVEWEKVAAMSYKLNYPNTKVINTNIKSLDPSTFEKVDIIIGGPPCQGFSNAGDKKIKMTSEEKFKDDPRNELYKEFLRFVDLLRPKEFIMENVEQIKDYKEQIINDFNEAGYNVDTILIKGNEIGMKQNRKRFFFIGKLISE